MLHRPDGITLAIIGGTLLLVAAVVVRWLAPALLGGGHRQIMHNGPDVITYEGQHQFDAAVDIAWLLGLAGITVLVMAVFAALRR